MKQFEQPLAFILILFALAYGAFNHTNAAHQIDASMTNESIAVEASATNELIQTGECNKVEEKCVKKMAVMIQGEEGDDIDSLYNRAEEVLVEMTERIEETTGMSLDDAEVEVEISIENSEEEE
jgi:predicted membrane-bound mannosyltransferase